MEFPSVVLTVIFSFLEIEDLVRAARVCKVWWKVITRGAYLKEAEPYELDLSRSEDAYRFVPLKMFALLTHLNISSTEVSNRHFEQLSRTAENLEFLDISNCSSLEQSSIFQAKKAFSRLEYVDISGNQGNFTILAVACLCSCESLQMIVAHGFTFTVEELLFLSKTFESVSRGELQLKLEDGDNVISVVSTFEEELFDEFFS
ncbi:unnamed protein product [Porites evermanni]|uniref:F-box domain-containing protein n=1 Tax=Porites evermanni TaxID=104178 RepID=A0ABN8SWS1_9CNID|nr:unnamed protein product [Porites evermanni]